MLRFDSQFRDGQSAEVPTMAELGYNAARNVIFQVPAHTCRRKNSMKPTIALVLLLVTNWLAAENATFTHVRIHRHRSPQGHLLADREGLLTFDDVNRKITFHNIMWDRYDEPINLEASYDSVTKVVFDSTSHMRGEGNLAVMNVMGFAGIIAAAAVGAKTVQDNWLYLEYKHDDRTESALLMLPSNSLADVQQEVSNLFADRVTVSAFPEHSEDIPKKQLRSAEFKSKFALKLNKMDHPLPTQNPEKATIIVVCQWWA